MNLKQVRRLFVEWSGREDLVNEDYSDRGADEFIRQAADWLDENLDHPKSETRHVVQITQGDFYIQLPRCQAITGVWIMGTDVDGQYIRRQLEGPRTMAWIRNEYNEKWSSQSQDTPRDFGLNIIGLDGSQQDLTSSDLSGYDDIEDLILSGDVTNHHFQYTGILLAPVADQTYTVNVFGRFYQSTLTDDTDLNYWTVVKPFVLAKAACRMHEGTLRNFQGEKDWMASLDIDLQALDKSSADLLSAGLTEMNG